MLRSLSKNASRYGFMQVRTIRTHRTVNVQLTADVPGLGLFGSIHEVAPGRMRNYLAPRNLAKYVIRGVGPQLLQRPSDALLNSFDASPSSTKSPSTDLEELRQRIASLPPLLFTRRAKYDSSSTPLHTQRNPIYGSVTIPDIVKYLADSHSMTLVPPDAIVNFKGVSRLKGLGQWEAQVELRDGQKIPLTVQIEKEAV